MMWNALVSGLLTPASIVLYDGNPGSPDMGVLWDLAEASGITTMGVGAALHPRLHEGRRRAAQRPRAREPARRRVDRIAALAGGLRLDLRAARRPDVAVLDVGRHRRLLGLRRRHPDRAGAPRRDPGAPPRRRRRGVRRAGPQRRRHRRRAGADRAAALVSGRLLERPGRRPLPRDLLLAVPRRVAARRLDPHHARRLVRHLRPQRLDHQPRRRAHGHGRAVPRRARTSRPSSTRWPSTSPTATAPATRGCRCSWCWPTAPS